MLSQYWEQIRDVAAHNLVFLNELGFNLAMAPFYGIGQDRQDTRTWAYLFSV